MYTLEFSLEQILYPGHFPEKKPPQLDYIIAILRPRYLSSIESRRPRRVSIDGRYHWSKYLTILDHSLEPTYTYPSTRRILAPSTFLSSTGKCCASSTRTMKILPLFASIVTIPSVSVNRGICKAGPTGLDQMNQAVLDLLNSSPTYQESSSSSNEILLNSSPTHQLQELNPSSTSSLPPTKQTSTNSCNSTSLAPIQSSSSLPPTCKQNSTKRTFAKVVTDQEVEEARAKGVPQKTQQDTKYCYGLWESWVEYRVQENGDNIGKIQELGKQELQYWLTRFILEVQTIQ